MAERWLVIDDSSTIQRVIKLAFQGYDVVITEADSCQDAAREIMSHPPSLVIADAALGGVQGVQDFLALKAQVPQAPFIILEGSYDNIDEAQFQAVGFRHFLKKPFDGAQLLSVTRQALGRALPYRGEAAMAAAAGAPQHAMQPPTATMPPPPPPVRAARPVMDIGTSFPPESTHSGFDLGLHESREARAAMAATQMSPAMDPRALAQTIVSEARSMAQSHVAAEFHSLPNSQPTLHAAQSAHADMRMHQNVQADMRMHSNVQSAHAADMRVHQNAQASHAADMRTHQNAQPSGVASSMSQSGSFGRKEAIVETVRNPMSFSLEDDEPLPQATAAAASMGRVESTSWEGPRPAGSQLGNLLEPMLQEEMEKLVRIAVEDYCRKHFAGIARELIQRELDRLTQDRSRLLMD